MTQAILALEIDGYDVNPIGVFRDVESARDAILEQEKERGRDDMDFAFDKQEFLDNLQAVWSAAEEQEHEASTLDMQFESGFGSWDIRLVTVEVEL